MDAILHAYGEAIAAYLFDSNFSVNSFKNALATGSALCGRMWTAVPATDVRYSPPRLVLVGEKGAQDEQILAAMIENLNNQNLWILVSAFESYEKFFKDFYGALGYLDRNLWLCSDFGDTSLGELDGKDMAWHQEQVRKTIARHDIKPILSRLRKVFPVFADREAGPDDYLRMWVGIAGAFRNCIVHARAALPKSDVTHELEKACGESFTGKKEEVVLRRVSVGRYFRFEGEICHLEGIDRKQLKPSYVFVNKPTTDLIEKLVSHAALAYSAALMHFGRKPFWERGEHAPT